MKRYIVFGFNDYEGTDLTSCILGTSNHFAVCKILADDYDTIQVLDTHSGAIWEWDGRKWRHEGNANE